MTKEGSKKSTSKSTRRRTASTYYKNDKYRCAAIVNKGKDRCKRDTQKGGNLCTYHNNIRLKQQEEHLKLLKKRGGRSAYKYPVYEYDYYLDEDVEPFDSNAAKVASGVWIGSIDSANDVNFLKNNGIKSIVNISGMEPSLKTREMYKKCGTNYYTLSEAVKVPYKSHYRVHNYLGDEKFRKGGLTPREFFKYMHKGCKILNSNDCKFPVLINCHAGVNRSGSLIAAYLLTKPNRPYSYERAVELLEKANKKRNLDVLTNNDFRRSLRYFPIFEGTSKNLDPRTIAHYKRFMKSYE